MDLDMDQETLKKFLESLKKTILFICGTAYYFTVLYLSRDRPTIYIDEIHVSSLNKTSNSLTNTTTIYFDLRIKNENSGVGVYYDNPLNLTISYFPPAITTDTNFTIGKQSIQGFYQGNGKVKSVQTSMVVPDLFSNAERRRKLGETYVSLTGPAKVVVFKVDLEAKIKFKSIENKKSNVVVGAVVEVNGNTGNFVLQKSVELKYSSGSNKWGAVQWLLFFPTYIFTFVVSTVAWTGLLIVLNIVFYAVCINAVFS